MSANRNINDIERKITPIERVFTRSPFSIVTLVARIQGDVSESMLRNAVFKVQKRHQNLQVRIVEDEHLQPWFVSSGCDEIPIEIVQRVSEDQWVEVHQEASKIPFAFDERPAIRFILVHSPSISELIIMCHHILCDGLSLAYLARDIMVHLGDPTLDAEVLPDPNPIGFDNMPSDVSQNALVTFLINRINRKWEAERVFFDQEDYQVLNQAYWDHFHHRIIPMELSESQTTALIQRCRAEHVTVNSALTTALVGSQILVQGDQPFHSRIAIAGNVRDRLPNPAGETMGFYAGVVRLNYKYDRKKSLWENTRKLHKKVNPQFTNKNLFEDFQTWLYLDPTILEAINFKKLGGLVPADASRHQKLAGFSQRDDVVLSILKRDKMESLDRTIFGTAVTNLTRMDFPRKYGSLTLDRLIMQPGGAFPLVNVNLVLGAVTCAGKLSLVIEYAEEAVDPGTMSEIKDQALSFLLEG